MGPSLGFVLFLTTVAMLSGQAMGKQRQWTDIETYHSLNAYDGRLNSLALEVDPLSTATAWPSESLLTLEPTAVLTAAPSASPSLQPSLEASMSPTQTPPTAVPVAFRPNGPPLNPDQAYFNYNTERTSNWGPGYPKVIPYNASMDAMQYQNNAWVTRSPPNPWYWSEFDQNGTGPWAGVLGTKNIRKNQCGTVGDQSPIDIRPNGAECLEHHQIRTLTGDYSFNTGQIKPQILSNKLRLLFDRRPCPEIDLPECSEPDPPQADFPNNWGGFTDLMHVDFKIPSEHLIYGEQFDAEMQVVHLHPTRRRTPTRVSLMRARQGGYNSVLQIVIDRFQFLFDDHAAKCAAKTRRERKLLSKAHRRIGGHVKSAVDYSSWGDFSTLHDAPLDSNSRRLQSAPFSPHHSSLIPSIYFYSYEGSLTEPPCSEFVTWFVCDVPMQISVLQLEQLKRIQFNYVDPNCNKTSIHYASSNARPIQDTLGRPVWRCTPRDFVADPPGYNAFSNV